MRVFYLAALVALSLVLPSWAGPAARGQERPVAPRKFDEFGNLRTDDVMARLDAFASELQKVPTWRGFIVGHGEPRRPPGNLLRIIHGYLRYLTEKRGVSPETVKAVGGGGGESLTVELWLVPEGAPAPTARPAATRPAARSPFKFDEILLGEECLSEFTIELETLDDGLKFYAEALRANPKARGRITIFPGLRTGAAKAGEEARRAKKLLTSVYGVEAARVVTRTSRRRGDCARAELWVEPNGAAAPSDDEDELMSFSRGERGGMSGGVVEAYRANEDLGVADLDHAAWARARAVRLTRYWSGAEAPAGRHAEARLVWTKTALLARFTYRQQEPPVVSAAPRLAQKTLGLWERDVCEIFVAPDAAAPEHYFEFEAAPTGEWLDLEIRWRADGRETNWEYRSGMTAAARVAGDVVTIAVRVPWGAFGRGAPRAGERWRANLFRCAGAGETRGYVAWQPTHAPEPSFHVPEKFGWLEFK